MLHRTALTLFVTASLMAAQAAPAPAAKTGGGTSASITLNSPSPSLSSTNPSFGSTVSFTITYPAMKWIPEVSLNCSQKGQEVYLGVETPTGSGSWTPQFTLWSQQWANNGSGPAECTAKLYYYTWQGKAETGVVYLAQTSFVTS
jgi:hypothetical protein